MAHAVEIRPWPPWPNDYSRQLAERYSIDRQAFEALYLGRWESPTREEVAESLAVSASRSGLVVVGYDPASEADLSAIVILVAPARQGAGYRERLAESLQARAEREYPGVTVIVRFA